jgi:uncharacterized protein YndB with AHSA1/START domain
METTGETTSLEREVEIAASPEAVWEHLTDPDKAVRWWGRSMTFDLRPGGVHRVAVTPGSVARGEFVEVDPPRRLVFTWGWEVGGGGPEAVPPGSSTVEIDLIPTATGTLLRLVHSGLPDGAAVEAHGQGWTHYLGRLAVAAPGGDPGPDPWQGPGG